MLGMDGVIERSRADHQGLFLGGLELLIGDEAQLVHATQHVVLANFRRLGLTTGLKAEALWARQGMAASATEFPSEAFRSKSVQRQRIRRRVAKENLIEYSSKICFLRGCSRS